MSKKKDSTKFWVEDPCVLFTDMFFFPTTNMTKEEKLNALTRLILIITLVMYIMEYKHWLTFLILSILIVVLLEYAGKKSSEKFDKEVEEFSIVPTYVGTDFQQTIVAPTFAEEWQIPPPAYDIYTQVPYPGESRDTFEMPLRPQSYPYGQYLTRTNLLPSDEYYTHLGCGSPKTAREYANSAFLRHSLSFRENMMRIYKKRLNRRWRNNCNDTWSPYHSY